jgi:hypothetical protein
MANAYLGDNGALPLTVYTTPAAGEYALDSVTFRLQCGGTATEHHPVVEFIDNSGETVAVHRDMNVAADGFELRYTFGINLIPSACTALDGDQIEHDLLSTVLDGKTKIRVRSVDETGTDIPGDTITQCILYGTQLGGVAVAAAKEPIYFMPGSAVA